MHSNSFSAMSANRRKSGKVALLRGSRSALHSKSYFCDVRKSNGVREGSLTQGIKSRSVLHSTVRAVFAKKGNDRRNYFEIDNVSIQ